MWTCWNFQSEDVSIWIKLTERDTVIIDVHHIRYWILGFGIDFYLFFLECKVYNFSLHVNWMHLNIFIKLEVAQLVSVIVRVYRGLKSHTFQPILTLSHLILPTHVIQIPIQNSFLNFIYLLGETNQSSVLYIFFTSQLFDNILTTWTQRLVLK